MQLDLDGESEIQPSNRTPYHQSHQIRNFEWFVVRNGKRKKLHQQLEILTVRKKIVSSSKITFSFAIDAYDFDLFAELNDLLGREAGRCALTGLGEEARDQLRAARRNGTEIAD